MNAVQIAISLFGFWISIVGPIAAFFYAGYREIYALRSRLDRNDERWLDTQGKILAIMNRLEMSYTDPMASNIEKKGNEK